MSDRLSRQRSPQLMQITEENRFIKKTPAMPIILESRRELVRLSR
jgi:hypothetical protein